jgi:hypothetical protein
MKVDAMTITPTDLLALKRDQLAVKASLATEERAAQCLLLQQALPTVLYPKVNADASRTVARLLALCTDALDKEEKALAALKRAQQET